MTLLILPLMEGVPDSVDPRPPVAEFLDDDQGQLVTFCISFVLVAMFWVLHHRVFRADTPGSSLRTMVNFAWMFTIVLMPVTTALSGAMATDRLMLVLYDGNLLVSSWLLFALTWVESAQRRRHDLITPNRTILAAPLAMSILFTIIRRCHAGGPAVGLLPAVRDDVDRAAALGAHPAGTARPDLNPRAIDLWSIRVHQAVARSTVLLRPHT